MHNNLNKTTLSVSFNTGMAIAKIHPINVFDFGLYENLSCIIHLQHILLYSSSQSFSLCHRQTQSLVAGYSLSVDMLGL